MAFFPRVSAGSYRTLVFAVLACAYMMVTFQRLSPAVVAVDMMRDLQAGGGLIGLLSGAFFYSYAAMQIPAGLLADSWGARRATSAFFCLAAAGSCLMGLAPDTFWAGAGRVLVGIGLSMIWASSLKTLAEWYPPDRFSAMTGLLISIGGAGSLLATAPLAVAVQMTGWRGAFLALGGIGAALAALLWAVVRDTPARAGYHGPGVPRGLEPGRQALWPAVRMVFASRRAWTLGVWLLLSNGVYFCLAGLWAGPFLRHVHGLGQAESGLVLAMISVGLLTGAPFMSHLSSTVLKSRRKALLASTIGLIGLTGLLAARPDIPGAAWLYAFFFLFGVFGGASPVVAFTSAKELFPVSMAGTAIGVMNVFPFLGAAIFQPLFGAIMERHGRDAAGAFTLEGYKAGFSILFFACAALVPICLALAETYREPEKKP
jgi:MFS family permease